MSIRNEQQLKSTEQKLSLLDQWITQARTRPASPENDESLRSLVQMSNQLREEIIRYRSTQKRQAG